jgi:hypothetical protein
MDKVLELTVKDRIIFFDFWKDIFAIYADGNGLAVDAIGDASGHFSIVGYRIMNNSVRIIIKNRTWELVKPVYNERFDTTIDMNYYYLVELEEVNGKLEYYCNRISEINLNEYIINDAKIYKKTNARLGPSIQWNKKMELEEKSSVKIIGVEKNGDGAYNTYDYWFKVIIDEQAYWVFGFFIDFNNRMRIKE